MDRARAVTERGGDVLIPVQPTLLDPEVPTADGGQALDVVQASVPSNPRRPPLWKVREQLAGTLPGALLDELPTGWQLLGDVLLLRMPTELSGHGTLVAEAYADVLDARSVLALEGTRGELREPVTRHLHGDPDTGTVHREDGLVYHLDPAEVLFSAGNHHERHRLNGEIRPGERVVDLFAGIGYFTLPLARAGAHVVACEKNPTAAAYLRTNVQANGLSDRIELREGDCRERAPRDAADRVLMGYFPGTHRFLGCALRALGPGGGWIHYHTVAEEPGALEAARGELTTHLPPSTDPRIRSARRVKGVGPGRTHVVLDVEVVP